MKEVRDTWCIQIDVTNICDHQCSNCTHLVGCAGPWKMEMDDFVRAIDSLEGWENVVGIIGGNPVLHPDFEKMVRYLESRFPIEQRGIWIANYGKDDVHKQMVKEVFSRQHEYFNDHVEECLHSPILVASQDVIPDVEKRERLISDCWLACDWSPSITPKGCYRCEVMGAFDMALDLNLALPLEKEWWKRPLSDFQHQIDAFCNRCGVCVPAYGRKASEATYDISPTNKGLVVGPRADEEDYDCESYDERKVIDWFPVGYRRTEASENTYGITVCVGMAETLKKILPFNLPHLKELIVMTTPDDDDTRECCKQYPNVRVIETDVFYKWGAKFNKGAAVELATMLIPKDNWIIIFDADICFPCDLIGKIPLDVNFIYSSARHFATTEDEFESATRERNFDFQGLAKDPFRPWKMAKGYFQLFHGRSETLNRRPWYGIDWNNAGGCDKDFSTRWDIQRRIPLEAPVLHLGAVHNWDAEYSSSWTGSFYRDYPGENRIEGLEYEEVLVYLFEEARKLKKESE